MRFYPFPPPTIWMDRPQPGGFEDYDSKVASWMIRCGFRYLRESFDLPGLEFPAADDLARWMSAQALLRGGEWAKRIDVEERAQYAAHEALKNWNPEVYVRASRWGSRSRRGPSVTIEDVQAKEGLSIAQAAKELGCSTATVKRRRAEIRSGLTTQTKDLFREMDRQIAVAMTSEVVPVEPEDEIFDLLTPEADEVPVSEIFNGIFAQYGLTRELIRLQTPDWTTPDAWAEEHEQQREVFA